MDIKLKYKMRNYKKVWKKMRQIFCVLKIGNDFSDTAEVDPSK